MALRSVIDIDVNDAEWKRFSEEFSAHQKAVKTLPGAWSDVGKETDKVADGFADMVAALMSQNKLLHEQTAAREKQHRDEDAAAKKAAAQERASEKARGQADREHQRALDERQKAHQKAIKDTGQIAKNIGGATLDLLKWVSLGNIAGVWGLGALAGSVSNTYRTATGLGVSSGAMQALGVNYGRYFDTNSALGNIAGAQNDLSKRWIFQSMGINPEGKDPGQLAALMAPIAKRIFEQGGMTQQYADARGLTQIFSMEDLRRLHAASGGDLTRAGVGYARDTRALGLNDRAQQAWQNFHYELDRAGIQIKNVLADGLTPLVPALRDFAGAVAESIKTFLSNPKLKEWIHDFGEGMKTVAQYVASDKFQNDVKTFVSDFALIVEKIAAGLRLLGVLPGAPAGAAQSFQDRARTAPMDGRLGANGIAGPVVSAAAARRGVDVGILQGIYGAESNFGHHAGRSSAGAMGPFQFMPGTAAQYGVDVNSLASSADGAARYMARLVQHYHGDIKKAVAAYNWGEGNLDRDIKAHPFTWLQNAPRETQGYVKTVTGIAVVVNNNTGGAASVQAAQLPQ